MNNFDALKIANSPAWEAAQKLQDNSAFAAIREIQSTSAVQSALEWQNTGVFSALKEMQRTLSAIRVPMAELNASIKEYQRLAAPIAESIKIINTVYAPIFKQTILSDTMNLKAIISGVQSSASVMRTLSGLNISNIASIFEQLPKYDFSLDIETDEFTVDEAERLYESGEITQDDINEELSEIVEKKLFSPVAEWDKLKKSKWFLAIKVLLVILTFVGKPVIDYTTDKALDAMGITQMWDESGVYDIIDSLFANFEDGTVSEEDAKATVDEAKTGNISKQKREDLLAKIKEIRTFISSAPQDDNTGNLLSYLSELEKDVCGKKYGLVFEEHREDIDEVLDTHTPVLTEDAELFIDNGGQMNFLIEGDNLASLKLLEKTHKGKIDLIYIDPPYNTGGTDFRYDDTVVGKDDTFRHSKWVSFIKKRLAIAKSLLSDDGIIFISIDENEQAALKLICDDVFSAENHIETIIWKNKYGAGAKTVGFISVHEYILCYSKNPIKDITSELDKEGQAAYKKKDDKFGLRGGYLTQPLMTTSLADRPNLMYNIEYNGDIITPRKQWVWSQDRLMAAIANDEVEFNKQKDGTYSVRAKKYLIDENGNMRRGKPLSILNGPFTQDGTKEIRHLLGSEEAFKFAKPSELIRYFVSFNINDKINKDAIILDFFAGSGTTAQAVLEQNKRDGGNRKFILCTNNENNICREVTYERIKRVIDKEGYEASLKYYKVEYIPISERMYYEYADDLLLHIRELVELENGVNFKGNAEIGIVLTEEELDEFIENADAFSKCKKLYMGHDLLPSDEQEEILKARDIEISIIPDYYYRDLQEG